MHEFNKFLYHGLQKCPVGAEEVRELAHYVHNVSSYEGLVSFATGVFTQVQELLNDTNYEFILFFCGKAARDTTESVAKLVESVEREE